MKSVDPIKNGTVDKKKRRKKRRKERGRFSSYQV